MPRPDHVPSGLLQHKEVFHMGGGQVTHYLENRYCERPDVAFEPELETLS